MRVVSAETIVRRLNTHCYTMRRLSVNRTARMSFLFAALVVPSAIAHPPPPVKAPEAVQVPKGHKLVATFSAKGVQVYEAKATKTGDLEWTFEGPLAQLSDGKGAKVGIHYCGPTWEAADGSKVVKPKDIKPTSVDADKATDLPSLLIPVK